MSTKNPYERNNKHPVMLNSVFAFVDILGYRDIIQAARGNKQKQRLLTNLHSALSSSREWLDESFLSDNLRLINGKYDFALKAFTDNIAIGWPINSDGETELMRALESLASFQLTMVNAGFFVRGAISVGDVYLDDIVVFGDSLLEAYEGESSLARDPRIILTETARTKVTKYLEYYGKENHAPQNREVLRDTDGQWFLNYLDIILIAEDEQGPFYDELEKHKGSVEAKLKQYRKKPPIFAKYAWTAGYHNYFCDLHNFTNYRIAVKTFEGDRGFIVDDI